mgnify:CR=1 FL=1
METEHLNDELEIDLIDLLLYLKRKIWLLLLGLLAGVLLSALFTFKIVEPMYGASSMIYMRGAGNTISSFRICRSGRS